MVSGNRTKKGADLYVCSNSLTGSVLGSFNKPSPFFSDVFSPTTSNPISVLKAVSSKVEKQASTIVVNLADSPLTVGQIEKALGASPVKGLKTIYLMKGGEFKVLEVSK